MVDLTGFIVTVKPIGGDPVEYEYDGRKALLTIEDDFIGYLGCMHDKNEDDTWKYADIDKITLIDKEKLLFHYKKIAVFDTNKVVITIKAKRGPESNNKGLPEEYDQYETWNKDPQTPDNR